MENKQRKRCRKSGRDLTAAAPAARPGIFSARKTPRGNAASPAGKPPSQWPVQIKLVPVNAPYFDGARLLIAADCTAYAYAAFHERFIRGHITLVGCPKLDSVDYSEKLTEIIRGQRHHRASPSCEWKSPAAAGWNTPQKGAPLQNSGKFIPWQVVTVTVDGRLVEE